MYISRIEIQNFRNFQHAEIKFHEGVNVIIGHNNSGKSNLLRALGLVFDSSATKRLTVDDFNKTIDTRPYFAVDSSGKGLVNTAPPKISARVTITESTNENRANEFVPDDSNTVFDWRVKVDEPYAALLTYEFFLPEGEDTTAYEQAIHKLINDGQTSPTDYWTLIRRRFVHKYIARIYGGPAEQRSRVDTDMLSRFDFQFLDAMRDAERYLSTGRTTLLRDVLNYFLDDDIKANTTLDEEARLEQIEGRSIAFAKQANTLIESVKQRVNEKPILQYSRDVGASIGGEPSFEGETTEIDLFSTLRLIIRDQLGTALPAGHNGLGYNNLIFMSILLAKMQMSASNYGSQDDKKVFPMLLIEEPEAHLHPSMQFKLLKFLRQNIKDKKQVRQVFVTTHSTHITAAVDLDEIICLNITEDYCLNVAYPGSVFSQDDEADRQSKAYVQRFLDATKSDMLFAKRVIFVEGITEQILMPCLASYESLSLEDNHISVINVGGRYFHHFLRIFDYDPTDIRKQYALNKKVACITDADPTRRMKKNGGRYRSCYPYQLHLATSEYDSQKLSTTCVDLSAVYGTSENIRIYARTDGKGRTLEYDLAFENPGCRELLTQGLANIDELVRLMIAHSQNRGLNELLAISKILASRITQVPWSEEDKIRSLIATRYHQSLESRRGRGAHALELEYNLRMNLNNSNTSGFKVPSHIGDALKHVVR